jgi:hypothetical protein
MAENSEKKHTSQSRAVTPEVRRFVEGLDEKYRMLVILKAQLYGNRWEPMLEDLRNRLHGKPYIFKLAGRIKEDMERIERMRLFEAEHGIDLGELVEFN